ncbi:3892_t:CDS:10, partial [Funneliformis geosporum]
MHMLTAIAKGTLPTKVKVQGWNCQELRGFLVSQKNIKYIEKYAKIIIDNQKVDGSSFLLLNNVTLRRWKIPNGPAKLIENLVKQILGNDDVLVVDNIPKKEEVENWNWQKLRKFLESREIQDIEEYAKTIDHLPGRYPFTRSSFQNNNLDNFGIIAKKSAFPTVKEVLGWKSQKLHEFLKSNCIFDKDIKIITDKVQEDGSYFLLMNSKSLGEWGIDDITARKIETLIEENQVEPNTGEVSILIDHSNLFKQGQKIMEKIVDKPNLRVSYERLQSVILNERNLGGPSEIFYSKYNNNLDEFGAKYGDQGFNVNPIEQRTDMNKEKKVDVSLVIRGMEILENRLPGILVIVTGDSDFLPLVKAAFNRGWKVETWFWSRGLNMEYKSDEFKKNYSLNYLDKHILYARELKLSRELNYNIKDKNVKLLKDKDLLQLFAELKLFGCWRWINDDHLSIAVHTKKQYNEAAIGLGVISILLAIFEEGTRPVINVSDDEFFPRPIIVNHLKAIFQPAKHHSRYYTVYGEHGTGKTTLIRLASREVGHGVVYVDVPHVVNNFGKAFGEAINFAFEEDVSYNKQLRRKLGNTDNESDDPKWVRALIAFQRAAEAYKVKYDRPMVIVYDNISRLDPETIRILQNGAKDNADSRTYIAVFVSSEGSVPKIME